MEIILALISIAAAAAVAIGQVFLTRSTIHGELLYELLRRLSEPEARDDRARMYALASKPFNEWSGDEYACVERVATVFDQVGLVLKHRYVTMRVFMTWYGQVVLCYQVAEPLIRYRREKEDAPVLFVHFEWLARRYYSAGRGKFWWERRSWRRLATETSTLPSTYELEKIVVTRRTEA